MTDEKLLRRAILTYGITPQLDMAIEEMSELTKEVCKRKRGVENRAAIIEELADVEIMLAQLKIICDISECEMDRMTLAKLDRLAVRLAVPVV